MIIGSAVRERVFCKRASPPGKAKSTPGKYKRETAAAAHILHPTM